MKQPWWLKEKKIGNESHWSVNIFWVWFGRIELFFKKLIGINHVYPDNVHQYHFRRGRKRSEYKLDKSYKLKNPI